MPSPPPNPRVGLPNAKGTGTKPCEPVSRLLRSQFHPARCVVSFGACASRGTGTTRQSSSTTRDDRRIDGSPALGRVIGALVEELEVGQGELVREVGVEGLAQPQVGEPLTLGRCRDPVALPA